MDIREAIFKEILYQSGMFRYNEHYVVYCPIMLSKKLPAYYMPLTIFYDENRKMVVNENRHINIIYDPTKTDRYWSYMINDPKLLEKITDKINDVKSRFVLDLKAMPEAITKYMREQHARNRLELREYD